MTIEVDPEWWKTIFDEFYLLTDARSVCDDEITQREVDLICQLLPMLFTHRIVDLCGGHGRHSLELSRRGFTRCTLVDYSEFLLNRAGSQARQHHYPMDCILADARNTGLASQIFDHALIMGNSLGYLPEPSADRKILTEAKRVLRPQGWLLIDIANGEAVRNNFKSEAWHEIGEDILVCRRRKLEADTVSVREMVLSKKKGLIRDRTYSIRFYDSRKISELLGQAGFEGVSILTDFSPYTDQGDYGFMNHRMIATGRKA
ncbi:Methyltransferase type 11 [Syntrophobacter sp. SbD2]|nr:Methyltransferase type 11 [Syntrophobacter sp. SbD2]